LDFKIGKNQGREEILIDVLLQKERACEGFGYPVRQKEIIERLLTLIGSEDIKRAEVYIRLGDVLVSNRFTEAEDAYAKALELCRRLDSEDTELSAWRSMGFLKWRTGKDEEADSILQKVIELDLRKGDATVLAQDLFSHFTLLNRLGDFARVKKCTDQAWHCMTEVSYRQRNYILLMGAHYYGVIGDYDKAMEFLGKSQDLLKKFRCQTRFFIHLYREYIYAAGKYGRSAAIS
jgi:tetratricopeptide (TPR) repeat protein